MNIIFNPPDNVENRYIRLLVDQLRAKGYCIHPLDTIFSSYRHFRSIQFVHLNWFENVDESSWFTALRSFARKLTVLAVIRLSGKRLVWTLHNRASHEKGTAWFSRFLMRRLIRWSHAIVIHSRQSEDILATYGDRVLQRVTYVPHPNFIGEYGDAMAADPDLGGTLQLLFFGMVKPYKNLELLMEVVATFGSRVHLTIAGKAPDDRYCQKLAERAAAMGNVTLLPYFVPDSKLPLLLAQADAVVLPYDLDSSLNSGTAMLAFSYGKTVICPEIGTLSDLGSHIGDTFCYRYETPDQHRQALIQQIERAWMRKRDTPGELAAMGQRLYRYVADMHDPKDAGNTLVQLYQRLMRHREGHPRSKKDSSKRHLSKDEGHNPTDSNKK